jgi:hypothetical protein
MVALLVVMVPAAALGTPIEQQFQNYQSPTLEVSIQYPSDWKLVEESNDKQTFTYVYVNSFHTCTKCNILPLTT